MDKSKDIKDDILLKNLPSKNYYQQQFPKEIIVLHFTAGYTWDGAYNTFLKSSERVATPFIVDKEGPKYIVQLFDEKYWAYNLGIKNLSHNLNSINDKRAIGVEVVNVGPVWFKDNVWKDAYGKLYPAEQIIAGKNRDADGGVKFPDAQIEAVCRLVNYLCDKWNIPREAPKDKIAFQLPRISKFKGIVAHQIFRQDKYDMGVAWPWPTIIALCNLKEVDLT